MTVNIGNTVQWPLPVYNTPDIGVDDVRFKRIIGARATGDIQIFPGFANDGDYFLVETDYGTTDNYVKYYNSAMSLQWTKTENNFQFSSGTKTAISGITLQGSELFVLVSNASNNGNGDAYNLAKVVADGTVTNIGGATLSSGQLGYMAFHSYLSKPAGKSNFYAMGYSCGLEISASDGSVVESFVGNARSLNECGPTFITSDNRSYGLQLFSAGGTPQNNMIHYHNGNATFGLAGSSETTGISQSGVASVRLAQMSHVPWQMTPFAVSRNVANNFQFVDWGDYYVLTQRSITAASTHRCTYRGLWLKTRLDSWMKQFCDHFQIPVNNTFAS